MAATPDPADPASRELVTHGVTGRLAPPGDLDALCRQLCAVLSDLPATARMGQAARTSALVSGLATMISVTPATWAGTAHISTLEG